MRRFRRRKPLPYGTKRGIISVDCRLLTVDSHQSRKAVQVEIDHSLAGVFDSGGEGFGDFEEGFLGGALALEVAGAGEESRVDRAGLRESHAGLDSRFAGLARRGDATRGR